MYLTRSRNAILSKQPHEASNIAQFQTDLEALGFDVVRVREIWKFTHIRAIKTEQRPQDGIELRL